MCTVHTHTNAEHTHAHTNTHSSQQTPQPGKGSPARVQRAAPRGVSMYQLHNCLGQTKHSQHFVHLGNKEWMVQASAQLQRTFMQTPQLHCSVPAVPHCAPSAEWTHQAALADHTTPWVMLCTPDCHDMQHSPSSARFPPKHRGMAGVKQKALTGLVLSPLS